MHCISTYVESHILMKYIPPGSHIKIINGTHMGQTGRVVSLKSIDNKPTAVILTDGLNTEILCDVVNLQLSAEVTAGLSNLMGFELYDLVVLNENESAVVIAVGKCVCVFVFLPVCTLTHSLTLILILILPGTEKLRLINHLDIVKEVYPQEIQSKRNMQSAKTTGFDSQQHVVKIGTSVNQSINQ